VTTGNKLQRSDAVKEWRMERNNNKKGEIIQHLLKRDVLRHLQEHGTINYNLLHVRFNRNRVADIQAVLQDLTEWNYIEVDKDNIIRITTAGRKLLEDTN
jgi:predicted transcriptional regulator